MTLPPFVTACVSGSSVVAFPVASFGSARLTSRAVRTFMSWSGFLAVSCCLLRIVAAGGLTGLLKSSLSIPVLPTSLSTSARVLIRPPFLRAAAFMVLVVFPRLRGVSVVGGFFPFGRVGFSVVLPIPSAFVVAGVIATLAFSHPLRGLSSSGLGVFVGSFDPLS